MTAGQRNCHTEIADLAESYGLADVLFAVHYYVHQKRKSEPDFLIELLWKNARYEARETIRRDGLEPLDCEDGE